MENENDSSFNMFGDWREHSIRICLRSSTLSHKMHEHRKRLKNVLTENNAISSQYNFGIIFI